MRRLGALGNSTDDKAGPALARDAQVRDARLEVALPTGLEAIRPAIYAKGGDYTPDTLDAEERAVLDKFGTKIEIIPFEKGYSTSQLLTRIGPEGRASARPTRDNG